MLVMLTIFYIIKLYTNLTQRYCMWNIPVTTVHYITILDLSVDPLVVLSLVEL